METISEMKVGDFFDFKQTTTGFEVQKLDDESFLDFEDTMSEFLDK